MKKVNKKTIVWLIVLALLTVYTHAQQFNSEAYFTWAVQANGVTITGFTGTGPVVQIPPQIQGMPVVSIGPAAFRQRNIASVTIPDSVISIEALAFADNQLSSVLIPPQVTSIGYRAFDGNLLSVVIVPFSAVSIGDGAFGAAGLFRPDWTPVAAVPPTPPPAPPPPPAPEHAPVVIDEVAVQPPPIQAAPAAPPGEQQPAQRARRTHVFGFRLGGAFGLWSGLESSGRSASASGQMGSVHYRYDESNRFNFNFALYYVFAFTDTISLQAELNFMLNQGVEAEWQLGQGWGQESFSEEWIYTSVDIPILLRFRVIYGLFGLAAGFLVAGPHISIPVMGDTDNASMTFGLTVGGMGSFPAGGGHFVGDMRFITDFNGVFDGASVRRQAISLTLGYEWSF